MKVISHGNNEDLDIIQLNGEDTCKTYLIGKRGSHNVAIIDPKLEHINDYISFLSEQRLSLTYIIDTHTHADHISGAAALKDKYGAPYIMGRHSRVECITQKVKDNETIFLEDIPLTFIETPGHTRDSVSVIVPGAIFTGDALFLDDAGAGRDDLMGGDSSLHWDSFQKFKELDESLIVYPAHDYRKRHPSSLGTQKRTNPYLKFESKEEYLDYLSDLFLGPAEWMRDVVKANQQCTKDPNAAWMPKDSPSCESLGTLQIDPSITSLEVEVKPPERVKEDLQDNADILILDVRSPQEFEKGKLKPLPNSVNIPLTAIVNDVKQVEPFKDKEICIVCGSGKRSEVAAKILKYSGFKKAYVLEGGLRKWYGGSMKS